MNRSLVTGWSVACECEDTVFLRAIARDGIGSRTLTVVP
jgi:hypothetical protein